MLAGGCLVLRGIVALLLFFVSSAFAQRTVTGVSTSLGEYGTDKLSVQQIFTPLGASGAYSLKLRFTRTRGIRIFSSTVFDAGQCFGAASAYCIGYYTDDLRRQVFVSTEMGEVISYLLDFDGRKVHVLYGVGNEAPSGRVRAFPTWDDKGQFAIREQY